MAKKGNFGKAMVIERLDMSAASQFGTAFELEIGSKDPGRGPSTYDGEQKERKPGR